MDHNSKIKLCRKETKTYKEKSCSYVNIYDKLQVFPSN